MYYLISFDIRLQWRRNARSVRACPSSYCIGGNANDKTDCKHNSSERFNTDIIIIVIIIIIIIQPVRNLPLMSHCAEVAADAKKAPGANFSGVVAGPLREQAGMDALVLPSIVKQKAKKKASCTSNQRKLY